MRPEHLVQFAHMGAAFMEVVMGVERPRVALLSNGEEPTKGPEDVVAAHAALTADPGGIDFVGNVEGFAIGNGRRRRGRHRRLHRQRRAEDDGGHVRRRCCGAVRAAAMSRPRGEGRRPAARPALRGLRDEIDPEAQGGAVLLGLRRLGVVPHGSFGARGFASAIEVAARGVRDDVRGAHARAPGGGGGAAAAAGVVRRRR